MYLCLSPFNLYFSVFSYHDFRNFENIYHRVLRLHSADAASWTDIANTTTAQDFEDLTATTYYRAELQNGVCAAQFTGSFEVTVHELPTVAFSAAAVCEGLSTTFVNTSSVAGGSVASQVWDFGDASSSVSKAPVHKFAGHGTYPVKLIVTSKAGCTDSLTQAAVVHPNPVAALSFSNVCIGQTIDFYNGSTISLGSFTSEWTFGDGNSTTAADPSHTYAADGRYNVHLKVTSGEGCTAEAEAEAEVYPAPQTAFEADNVCHGNTTEFRNNSSISSGTLSWQWDFGDAQQSTAINPLHPYAAHGTYTATLRSTSHYGCTSEASQTVEVYEQPVAAFTAADICLSQPAVFTNTSAGAGLSWSWDFGDGQTSAEQHPTHAYDRAGVFNVVLKVENSSGCTDEIAKRLTVEPMPVPHFTMEDACLDEVVTFTNLSTIAAGTLSYAWSFGDGASAAEANPAHQYAAPGTYEVQLTATSAFGCQLQLSKEVQVFPLPEPAFEAAPVCDGSPMRFANRSTISSGAIKAFQWDFGDQTNSIVGAPEKQYLNPGTYAVQLKAVSDAGCEAAASGEVTVYEFPVANFSVENVCFGFAVAPQNLSEVAAGSLSYSWTFGDGSGSVSAAPVHTYERPGTYTITLSATSDNNCTDQVQRQVTVYSLPEAAAGQDTAVSQGYPVQLAASGGISYSWSPVAGLSNSHIATPIATPLTTTDYEVLVTDQYGCQNRDTVRISVDEDFRIVASNVFTPDENGQNDTWVIDNVDTFGDVNVRVYDRYGALVFQETAYENDWRGTYGNDILPDGTYFYVITFSASERKYQGALTIIRNR